MSRISLENSLDPSRTIPSEFLSVFRTKIWVEPVRLHHLLRQKKVTWENRYWKEKQNNRSNLLTICQCSLCSWLLMDRVSGKGTSSPRTPGSLWGEAHHSQLPFPSFSQQTLSLTVHINKENLECTFQSWACKPNYSEFWGTITQELAGDIVLCSPGLLSHTSCPLCCRL